MQIVTDIRKLQAGIKSIGGATGRINGQIQAVLPGIIFHAYKHGNVTLGTELLRVTRGMERQALIVYLEEFGPFRWDKANSAFKLNKARAQAEEFDPAFFESAECPKWWEYTKDTKSLESTFDLQVRVMALIKSMGNAKDKGKSVVHEDLSEYLQAALAKYNSDKALKAAQEQAQAMADKTVVQPGPVVA